MRPNETFSPINTIHFVLTMFYPLFFKEPPVLLHRSHTCNNYTYDWNSNLQIIVYCLTWYWWANCSINHRLRITNGIWIASRMTYTDVTRFITNVVCRCARNKFRTSHPEIAANAGVTMTDRRKTTTSSVPWAWIILRKFMTYLRIHSN